MTTDIKIEEAAAQSATLTGQSLEEVAKQNIVSIYVTDFNDEAAKSFADEFKRAKDSNQDVVLVYINSNGGSDIALGSMIDTINASGLRVITINMGKALSAGAWLLSTGTKGYRYAAPMSVTLVHEASAWAMGKTSDIASYTDYLKKKEDKFLSLLDKNCERSDGYFRKLLDENKNADLWFDAEEAKKHGIVDHVKLPNIEVDVDVKVGLK